MGDLDGATPSAYEGHDLAVLRVVRQWSSLCRQHDGSDGLQPGRDEVAEGPILGDVAIEPDPKDAVVVSVGDEEPAAMALQGVLHAGRDEEVRGRRMLDRPLTDVGDHPEVAVAAQAVDADGRVADGSAADDVAADHRDEHVGGAADELHVHRAADAEHLRGRPSTYVLVAPVLRSTRSTLPALGSVTYSAPSGPIVLPEANPLPNSASGVTIGPFAVSFTAVGRRRVRCCPRRRGRRRQRCDECCRDHRPGGSHWVLLTGMFWLIWKKLVGSYLLFSATSRS